MDPAILKRMDINKIITKICVDNDVLSTISH